MRAVRAGTSCPEELCNVWPHKFSRPKQLSLTGTSQLALGKIEHDGTPTGLLQHEFSDPEIKQPFDLRRQVVCKAMAILVNTPGEEMKEGFRILMCC